MAKPSVSTACQVAVCCCEGYRCSPLLAVLYQWAMPPGSMSCRGTKVGKSCEGAHRSRSLEHEIRFLGCLGRASRPSSRIDIVQYAPRAVSNPKPSQPDSGRPLHLPSGGCQVCRFCKSPASVDSCATMRWLHYRCLPSYKREGGQIFDVSVAASLMGDETGWLAGGSKGAVLPRNYFSFSVLPLLSGG